MSEKTLLLLPMPLYEGVDDIPPMTLEAFRSTNTFIAERARTLRRFLSKIKHPIAIDELEIIELDKHQPEEIVARLGGIFKNSGQVGFASEAGTPCIADPGFRVTAWAHSHEVKVVSLPGPNSIIMALMASGFSGQQFTFHGYLSAKKNFLAKDVQRLELMSQKSKSPQIFIEAPYRNLQVLEVCQQALQPQTRLHVSVDLNTENSLSITCPMSLWGKSEPPNIHKRPAVFIIFAGK